MSVIQQSKLLASVIPEPVEEIRLTVLHIGNALPETVDFFYRFRCRLHFVDLFAELPMHERDDDLPVLSEQFDRLFDFPQGTQFDLCLFWDIFNYLDEQAMLALQVALRPCLGAKTRAHGFVVHNLRSPKNEMYYSLKSADELLARERPLPLPGYSPHNQGRLKELLTDFDLARNLLLPDGRLELVLNARVQSMRNEATLNQTRFIL
jgi:hypothetical protein